MNKVLSPFFHQEKLCQVKRDFLLNYKKPLQKDDVKLPNRRNTDFSLEPFQIYVCYVYFHTYKVN